ncbi:prohormone-2-like isoform X4 [Periplaneta americana]|uniref:prohormone-2-like isoform X4 n=1 Tax=Periplaneta americana TaxID=6978 RepID=UPI0037E926AC
MAGVAATCALVTLLVAAVVALPNTLLEDTKQVVLESEPIISKVKRAQEVMMFGNQQNRPSTENKLYPSAHKRGSVNQYRYYGGSSERKRNQHLSYPPPSKRSYQPEMPFVLPTDDLTSSRSRLKRDLGLDPEDVLTVLSLWEAEHRAKAESNPGLDPSWFTYYGLDTAEPFRDDEDEGEEDEEDTSPIDGGWLEGPVAHPSSTPHRYRLERRGGYYYPMLTSPQQYPLYPAQKRDSSQWGGFAKDKRFMVSRKRQVTSPRDEVQTLAQLLNHPYRDPGVPLYRRVVL